MSRTEENQQETTDGTRKSNRLSKALFWLFVILPWW
jgi:hypothetical protein